MSTTTVVHKKEHYLIKVFIMFLITFGFRFIPAPSPITEYGMSIIGVFMGMIIGWIICGNNLVWPSLIVLFALSTTNYGTAAEVAQNSFGSEMVVLLICSMMILAAANASNISNYLIVKLITMPWAQGRPWLLTSVFIIGAMLLGLVINPIVAGLFLTSVLDGIFEKVGYKRGDAYPIMTNLGIFLAVIFDLAVLPWGISLMIFGAMNGATSVTPDYGFYFMTASPYLIITVIGYPLLMRLMRCDASKIANADFDELSKDYKNGLNKGQKFVLWTLIIMLLGGITISILASGSSVVSILLNKINIYGWLMLIAGVLMMTRIDGKPLLPLSEIGKAIDWGTIFVIATATVVAGALTGEGTGVSEFLLATLQPLLGGLNNIIFYFVLAAIALILTNFFNNIVIFMLCASIVAALYAQGVDINLQIAGATIAMMGGTGILTPAASVYGAMIHSNKYSTPSQVYKFASLTMLYILVTYAIIYLPLTLFVS